MSRAAQREETRQRIVTAAVDIFARQGFDAAGTRAIAERAGLTQGLLTYHFPSKDELWRAAADRIFEVAEDEIIKPMAELPSTTDRETGRQYLRIYVRFAARHPEVFHFMIDAQTDPDGRGGWLVETHLRSMYEDFAASMTRFDPNLSSADVPHAFYSMVGAGSALFALGEEARRLCGLNATHPDTVEAHADYVANMLLP